MTANVTTAPGAGSSQVKQWRGWIQPLEAALAEGLPPLDDAALRQVADDQ
jgi:hypothetical protein